ncbi:hypothetical protein DLAC_06000 [Tieghemostelium lacteum]|uniref:Transmembrane protein n=1 Tax=Tieghemostelium lacteum TaxID=361077 RepID=A0A151ZHH3_TIELA|nr:hypothetical protein DLAC_06000 [Tieghemostelium lacteum]|eukprot:KYQ93330.1 hypothetical protein DLAC_06000 [Tieghemostelium lacteum]
MVDLISFMLTPPIKTFIYTSKILYSTKAYSEEHPTIPKHIKPFLVTFNVLIGTTFFHHFLGVTPMYLHNNYTIPTILFWSTVLLYVFPFILKLERFFNILNIFATIIIGIDDLLDIYKYPIFPEPAYTGGSYISPVLPNNHIAIILIGFISISGGSILSRAFLSFIYNRPYRYVLLSEIQVLCLLSIFFYFVVDPLDSFSVIRSLIPFEITTNIALIIITIIYSSYVIYKYLILPNQPIRPTTISTHDKNK